MEQGICSLIAVTKQSMSTTETRALRADAKILTADVESLSEVVWELINDEKNFLMAELTEMRW
jgi:hypothetical protein